ncbi:hypothetical protein ACN9MF_11535 [Methylobacterium fujisawaense]|uniref:hypothetical protein n=1 Tax=Methylobacterium fujisawaense TaxID=107400 RepID=UPI003CE69273
MAVTLRILEESEYGPEPKDAAVPDGAVVTVRRHRQGADVTVLPGAPEQSGASAQTPHAHLIVVCSFTVGRVRPGCAEVVVVDQAGAKWRLFLSGDMGLDLAACLRGGERASSRDSHEAALARRANAEAKLAELEVAEKTRAARASDRTVQAGRLWTEFNADVGMASICAAEPDDEPELRIQVPARQIIWLVKQMLFAKQRLDEAAR